MNKRQLNAKSGRMKCELSFTPNSPTAKTAKIKAIARTSEPIIVPGWESKINPDARIVHDLSGMKLRKSKIPCLYNHYTGEGSVIGEWIRFEIQDGNLVASGILKSVSEGDTADELMKKLANGTPFESSINFSDELEIEEFEEGETASANGRVYEGPITIIRSWYLREISITPLGADPYTTVTPEAEGENNDEIKINSESDNVHIPDNYEHSPQGTFTFSAQVRERTSLRRELSRQNGSERNGESKMNEIDKIEAEVRTTETANEAAEAIEEVKESVAEVVTEAVDEAVEAIEANEKESFKKQVEKYGLEKAYQYFVVEQITEEEADKREVESMKQELSAAKEVIKKLSATHNVEFVASDESKNERVTQLMKSGLSKAQAEYISKNRK